MSNSGNNETPLTALQTQLAKARTSQLSGIQAALAKAQVSQLAGIRGPSIQAALAKRRRASSRASRGRSPRRSWSKPGV